MDNSTIKDLFTEFYGKEIGKMIEGHPQYDGHTVDALINIQKTYIIGDIKGYNRFFVEAELSDFRREQFNLALIQQMYYVLTEGDFRIMSGYDITSNTVLNKSELEKRYLAATAKSTLENAGLLYCAASGLRGRGSMSRRGW